MTLSEVLQYEVEGPSFLALCTHALFYVFSSFLLSVSSVSRVLGCMTPSQFLTVAGPASLFLGVLGFLQPDFSPDLWFDLAENLVHTGFGIIALFVLACSARFQWNFVLWISLVTVIVAFGGLLVAGNPEPNFWVTNLEDPLDNALHLTFVIAGLIACLPKTRLVAM